MLRRQVYEPLLSVKATADRLGDVAIVLYYGKDRHQMPYFEAELDAMERDIKHMRAALEAIRSRGEDPLAHPAPVEVPW